MKTIAKYIFYALLALAVISTTACSKAFTTHGVLTAYDPYMKPKFVSEGDFKFINSAGNVIKDVNTGKIYHFDNYIFEPEE